MFERGPIFLAGHRGLIGSAFARRLRQEGLRNVVIRPREELDLRRRAEVDAFFAEVRPALVLFCAGRGGGIAAQKREAAELLVDNLEMSVNCLRAARESGVKRFLYLVPSCAYPRDASQPLREECLLDGKPESTSLPYSLAKLTALQLAQSFDEKDGEARFLAVLTGGIYGPGDDFSTENGHVVPALLARFHEAKRLGCREVVIWGSGQPRREFLHVDDLVDACWFLLRGESLPRPLPINISPGRAHSIGELAALVARVVEYEGAITFDPTRPDGAPHKALDPTRLSALGWQGKISLEAGLRATYAWYRESEGAP